MLRWMIDFVNFTANFQIPAHDDSFTVNFFNFLLNGYEKVLNGAQDGECESRFVRECTVIMEEKFGSLSAKQKELESIKMKINEFSEEPVNSLDQESSRIEASFLDPYKPERKLTKREHLKKNLNSLKSDKKQLSERIKMAEQKIKKHNLLNERRKKEIETQEKTLNEIKLENEEIKKIINDQGIEPMALAEMNKEKMELYNELEKLKPLKKEKIGEISTKEISLAEKAEEIEKMLVDLKSLVDFKLDFRIEKENENKLVFVGDIDDLKKSLEDMIVEINEAKCELNEEIYNLSLKKQEQDDELAELHRKIEFLEMEIYRIGFVYLKKKDLFLKQVTNQQREETNLKEEISKFELELKGEEGMVRERIEASKILSERISKAAVFGKNETDEIMNELIKELRDKEKEIIQSMNK